MHKKYNKEIIRLLANIENRYPPEDLIITYSDYLKNGQNLHYYKYNPTVLEYLTDLTIQSWDSPRRIARLNLLTTIKQYVNVAHAENNNSTRHFKILIPIKDIFTTKIKENLFNIFKLVHSGKQYLTEKQIDQGKQISNFFLKDVYLTFEAIQWLCNHSNSSPYVLNRLLRYPAASPLITSWAKENFGNDDFRNRRAELTSWIIDEDNDYVISIETLIADFEYQNKSDKKAFNDYIDEIEYNQHLADELGDIFAVKKITDFRFEGLYKEPEILDGFTEPKYVLSKRFYKVPLLTDKQYNIEIPDFDALSKNFYENIQLTKEITMIWSIAYSRLSAETKSRLLRKYFNQQTTPSLLKVAYKFELVPLLKWMATL